MAVSRKNLKFKKLNLKFLKELGARGRFKRGDICMPMADSC